MASTQNNPNPAASSVTPSDRSTEFVAVQGGNEGTSAETLVVVAYGTLWLLLLGFVWLTWKRQRGLDVRLSALEQKLPGDPNDV